jgi:hypothetical protein
MAGPFNNKDHELFVKTEASYNDQTYSPAAADAIRSRTGFPAKRDKSRKDRDEEFDGSASVHGTVGGKEKATWEIEMAITPSEVTGTATAPDAFELFKNHMGSQDVALAHSTTQAGSTTTVIAGTAGAVAALGLAVGDFIGVQAPAASPTLGVEVRQVTVIATDNITVTPALSFAPLTGRALYGAVTYRLLRTSTGTVGIASYLNGDNARQLVSGAVVSQMDVSYSASADVPEAMVKFSGEAAKISPLTIAKPTGTFAGNPLAPTSAFAWVGSTKQCVTDLTLTSNNGQEVRNNESCSLNPTGVKRTGNNGKYKVELAMKMLLLTDGIRDAYYDVADDLTAYDVTVQLGIELGKIFAFRCASWRPDVDRDAVDGEASLDMKGRCYSNNSTSDTELVLAFL